MRDDLTMVRGEFVVWGLWVAAVGEVIVENLKVFHRKALIRRIRLKVPTKKDLVDAFINPAES